jgi:hypothetical protein
MLRLGEYGQAIDYRFYSILTTTPPEYSPFSDMVIYLMITMVQYINRTIWPVSMSMLTPSGRIAPAPVPATAPTPAAPAQQLAYPSLFSASAPYGKLDGHNITEYYLILLADFCGQGNEMCPVTIRKQGRQTV